MKSSFSFLFAVLSLFFHSIEPFHMFPGSVPEIMAGPTLAAVGISPLTGEPSGWYTSDVIIHVLAPDDVLANGQPMSGGKLTISTEGQQQVELQPGPDGTDNVVTQFVNIDKTAPQVSWITPPNTLVTEQSSLKAEISDELSGICLIEASFNHGSTWESQAFPAPVMGEPGSVHKTVWSRQADFQHLSSQAQVVLLRAHDCAGNLSPAEILVVRIKNSR
jgi:hypothetical protein